MPDPDGRFIWYELITTDTSGAEAFYRNVVGWRAQDSGLSDRSYTILSVGETPAAGLMAMPPEAREMRPGWIGYIAVDDVDSFTARVKEAGGTVHRAPDDIPSVGRFAVVGDPQGAVFVLFKSARSEPRPEATPGTPGCTGWHELHARDRESAFAFYSGLFGWTKAEAIDMGAMGVYQLFATGGVPVGGMMTKADAVPVPVWLYYFNVESIDDAVVRVKDGGGQILNGPHQVPGGSWIVHGSDPQGAMFALVGPRR